ncbi:MAG TPA: hypothetical protein VJ761_23130 [Ktedonobacteraceae bacterium]|nr:hypothetical protein [Ktedonobacteraceae bacterium]
MNRSSSTHVEPAVQPHAPACSTVGHLWHPTIILGYFQCSRCSTLAACVACVAKVRGKALPGYCQAHRHLRTCEMEWEVLG